MPFTRNNGRNIEEKDLVLIVKAARIITREFASTHIHCI